MNKVMPKLKLIALATLLIALVFAAPADALQRIPFGRSPRKAAVQLNLTKDAGPWLIMCTSFDGQDGRQQAINLANELRVKHGMQSYVYRQHFDFSKGVTDRGIGFQQPTAGGASNVRQREMQLARQNEKTEYAVLVGNYKSVESSKAQKDLATLKKLQPESLKIYSDDVRDSPQAGARLRADGEVMFSNNGEFKQIGADKVKHPLRLALLVTNPLLPKEVLDQAGIDQFILNLNKGVPYSLLDNPKAYTLKVASFSGEVIIRPKDIAIRKAQRQKKSSLVEAAKRAEILTKYLRSQKIEAYQFHDRHSSYVCVGGFDWVREGDGPNARGNPKVIALAEIFAGKPLPDGQVTTFKLPPRLLEAGVTCDANPLTVAVPRSRSSVARQSKQFR